MSRGIGGEGGARGGRDPNAGGKAKGGGGSGASGERGTLGQQQDRRNMANAGRVNNSAPGVSRGEKSVGSIGLRDLNPRTPGFGSFGPRGPMGTWGSSPEFSKAMGEYQNRGLGMKALDFLAGPFYDQVKPNPLDPRTYAGGTYHTGTNIPGVAGSLIGSALGPGLGMVGGFLGSQIPGGTVLHGGNPALAGYNTGTGLPGAAPGAQGGTGMGGQFAMRPITPAGARQGIPTTPATQQMGLPGLPQNTMGAAMLGNANYGVTRPSYNYFGGMQPAMFR